MSEIAALDPLMDDSSSDDQQDGDDSSPLCRLSFSVRSALDGRFFRPVSTDENDVSKQISSRSFTALCLKCNSDEPKKIKEVKVNIRSNSNLFSHLKRHHDAKTIKDFQKALESDREEFTLAHPNRAGETRCRRDSTADSHQSKFQQLIVDYIIHAMIPLQSIDDPTFKRIFDFLHIERLGLYVVSRRTLGRQIDETFTSQLRSIKQMLRPVAWICTTADIWSGGKRSFIGVTAHWLDAKNERKSVALACKRFKGSHTFDKIASMLNSIHQYFDLSPDKIVATVTDNGSNFVKAFRVFGVYDHAEAVADEEMGADTDISDTYDEETWASFVDDADDVADRLPSHLRCAAHTLALTSTTDILKVINCNQLIRELHTHSLEKCNVLWRMANRPKTAEIIEKIIGKSLSRPNETRWNTLYDSLKQIVEIRAFMEELGQALNIPQRQILSDEEYSYIEEYVTCAAPVAVALDLLQGEETAYYGTLVPTILVVKKKLRSLAYSGLQICGPIADAYIKGVERRFSQILRFNSLQGKNAAVAALSYPKFKKKWFPCIEQETQENLLIYFKDQIYNFLANDLRDTADNVAMEVDHPLEDFYDFGDEEVNEPPLPLDDLACKAQSIMDAYFNDKKSGLETLINYPSINHIFKKTNTPLPSSAHVERLFSYATMTNMPKSNRLSDEKFEQRVILRANASSCANVDM